MAPESPHPLLVSAFSCFIVLASSCSPGDDAPEPIDHSGFHLEFDLVHELEELSHPDQAFYIPDITAIRSYGDSDFFVTDNWLKQILHLDENGNIIRTIGSEGRGPGEFTDLWNVIPLRDGNIGVSNRGDARTIIFNSDGDPVAHHEKQPEDPYITGKVYPVSDDSYITPNHRPRTEYSDCIFVELDLELQPQTPCFGSYDELNESDVRVFLFSGISPFGDIHFIDEDKFLFVRGDYDGTHYIYHRTEDDWVMESTITGYTEIPSSVSEVPDTPSNREKGNWVRIDHPDEPEMFVLRHNQSMGYEVYDDQYVLHFTVTEQDGERTPGVELLTREGEYIGYQSLAELHDELGFNTDAFRLRAYNNGRLMAGTKFGLYIFDISLTFSE